MLSQRWGRECLGIDDEKKKRLMVCVVSKVGSNEVKLFRLWMCLWFVSISISAYREDDCSFEYDVSEP